MEALPALSFFSAKEHHVSGRLFSSSAPALSRQYSWHFAAVKELCKPDSARTSTELSALRSPEWSFSTALFGGVSSVTAWRPPIVFYYLKINCRDRYYLQFKPLSVFFHKSGVRLYVAST